VRLDVYSFCYGHNVIYFLCTFSDNYVYAWGSGEDGRLGFGQLDLAKGPNGKSVSIPRPIFGALHIVPHLSARHWHTILIAGNRTKGVNAEEFYLLLHLIALRTLAHSPLTVHFFNSDRIDRYR